MMDDTPALRLSLKLSFKLGIPFPRSLLRRKVYNIKERKITSSTKYINSTINPYSYNNYRLYVFLEDLINLWSPHEAVVEGHKLLLIENLTLLSPVLALVVNVSVGLIEQGLHLLLADLDIESMAQLFDFIKAQESTLVGICFPELFTQEPR